MSPITFTQQGIITQCELAKILIITSESTLHLAHRFKAYQLSMFFSVPKDKLISHPNFWYVFGYFDMKAMAFANPVFVVPSAEVHSHASPRLDGDRWTFNFGASLDPDSQDHWVPFRVQTHEVGSRVLDIFGNEQVRQGTPPLPTSLAELDGLVLVAQRP
jgi:hypothetical protein